MKLKDSIGVLEIKGLGVRLDASSSSAEIELTLKRFPRLGIFIEQSKNYKNDTKEKK